MEREKDDQERMKQELTRSERHRNPDLRAQRIGEIWSECGDWIEAVQEEARERGVELSRASARAKASVFRRRLANSPYWQQMLRLLPSEESARRNIETLLRAEKEANVVYQGKDTGLPDHRTRLQSVRQQQELRRGMDRTELGFHELDLMYDRVEIERKRNEVVEQEPPNVQMVLQLPHGVKRVQGFESFGQCREIDAGQSEVAALPDVEESEGEVVDGAEAVGGDPDVGELW